LNAAQAHSAEHREWIMICRLFYVSFDFVFDFEKVLVIQMKIIRKFLQKKNNILLNAPYSIK